MNDDKSDASEYTDKESKTSKINEAGAETDSGKEPLTPGEAFRQYQQQLTTTRSIKSFDPANPPQRHTATKSVPPAKNKPKDNVDDK